MNPFTYYKTPSTKLEAQRNLNYWQYELMGLQDDQRQNDAAGAKSAAITNSRDIKAIQAYISGAKADMRRLA